MGRTWTIEMFWRCKHCQTRCPGMKGAERESLRCTKCGAEKTDEPWIMPDSPETAPALTGELDKKARAGANWTCAYCKAQSRATAKACEVCGAARGVKPSPRVPDAQAEPTWICRTCGGRNAGVPNDSRVCATCDHLPSENAAETPEPAPQTPLAGPAYRAAPPPPVEPAPPKRHAVRPPPLTDDDFLPVRRWSPPEVLIWGVLGVLGLGLVVWFMVWLFTPNDTTARVRDVWWQRTEVLRERHSYAGEGWRRSAPSGVYSWDHCETRQNGTENCHPHDCMCRQEGYECNCSGGSSYSCNCRTSCSSNRNGSATCSESCSTCTTPRVCSTCYRTVCSTCYDQCPVYEDWCRYRYYQWDAIDRRVTGAHDTRPVWPGLVAVGYEQRVERSETYHVVLDDEQSVRNHWDRSVPLDEFTRYAVGQRWHVQWTHAGSLTILNRENQ